MRKTLRERVKTWVLWALHYRTLCACAWQVFEVDVRRLSIEQSQNCSGDRLQLFDGDTALSEPLCGQEPPTEIFSTHSSTLNVRFQSDQGGADAGFVIVYTVVDDDVDDDAAASGQRKGSQIVDIYINVLPYLLIDISSNLQYRPETDFEKKCTLKWLHSSYSIKVYHISLSTTCFYIRLFKHCEILCVEWYQLRPWPMDQYWNKRAMNSVMSRGMP